MIRRWDLISINKSKGIGTGIIIAVVIIAIVAGGTGYYLSTRTEGSGGTSEENLPAKSIITLRLEATQTTIEIPEKSEDYANNILERFRENLEAPTRIVSGENIEKTGTFKMEVGKYVSKNVVKSLLKEGEKLIDYEKGAVSESTQEQVENTLKTRVDTHGTLETQFEFTSLGKKNQYLQVRTPLDLEKAKRLLEKEGLPEIFIDNKRAIWCKHIRNVQKQQGVQEERWQVTFDLTEEGKERFSYYTGGEPIEGKPELEDKKGHPGVIYIDRPTDSILLFPKDFKESIETQSSNLKGIQGGGYSESAHRFFLKTSGGGNLVGSHTFYLQVPAVKINENNINAGNYILSLKQKEEINKALLLGKKKNFPIIQGDNLSLDNEEIPVENSTKLSKESKIEWLNRIVGLEAWPTLQPSITGNVENLEKGLSISTGSKKEAEDLRIILSERLPVEVTHISESQKSD